ncbi:alkane 1-monooxygenase [Jannaschia sp. CCS1]|uniref:alkane 1-monooxygenase n=1 Tax=Jannaschia sp. (strain CCS1) TaxID=290400 RepID=UPI000053D66D|nr:alkane 1-monooxygenase [Jannaschia sp. CCS1]ABD54130.1 alkane 1-monooxygenase [Jannaschia sp. CCS1]
MPVMARYAAITLPPMVLLLLAGTVWGGFAWMALIWLTLVAALADRLLEPPAPTPAEEDTAPWSDALSVGLAIGHLLLLVTTASALTSGTLTFGQSVALFFATASFFGQVSHPNAHELIHRAPLALRALGAAVYTSVGFGHHVSAHRLIHHRHVGTEADPNTPLPGESFWSYLPRAWRGSFEAGAECEVDRLEHKGRGANHITNPYWIWLGGALLSVIVMVWIAGLGGALVLAGLGALTGAQILMSDYVQHYGLQRLLLPNGRYEPVAAHHSWNAPMGFSSYLMMNAPAHSEHHLHPDRPYDRLDPNAEVPTLPLSMPIMAMIALIPSVWSRMMDRRALRVMEAAEAAHLRPPQPQPAPVRDQPTQVDAPAKAAVPLPPADATQSVASSEADPAPVNDPTDPEDADLLNRIRAATQ